MGRAGKRPGCRRARPPRRRRFRRPKRGSALADARLALVSALIAAQRVKLEREQRPAASLLAGLAMMARRPPLFALTDGGGTDELVKVRILLDSTLPVIRSRTSALSGEVAQSERLQRTMLAARQELAASRSGLAQKRQEFAALEAQALKEATAAGGQALGAGDVALAQGEDVEQLQSSEAGTRAAWALAGQLAQVDPHRRARCRPRAQASGRRSPTNFPPPPRSPKASARSTPAAFARAE